MCPSGAWEPYLAARLLLINKNVKRGMFSFNKVSLVDVRSVIAALDVKKHLHVKHILKIYQGIQ